jgi:hypothetical protein
MYPERNFSLALAALVSALVPACEMEPEVLLATTEQELAESIELVFPFSLQIGYGSTIGEERVEVPSWLLFDWVRPWYTLDLSLDLITGGELMPFASQRVSMLHVTDLGLIGAEHELPLVAVPWPPDSPPVPAGAFFYACAQAFHLGWFGPPFPVGARSCRALEPYLDF